MLEFRYTFLMMNFKTWNECWSEMKRTPEETVKMIFKYADVNGNKIVWIKDEEGKLIYRNNSLVNNFTYHAYEISNNL